MPLRGGRWWISLGLDTWHWGIFVKITSVTVRHLSCHNSPTSDRSDFHSLNAAIPSFQWLCHFSCISAGSGNLFHSTDTKAVPIHLLDEIEKTRSLTIISGLLYFVFQTDTSLCTFYSLPAALLLQNQHQDVSPPKGRNYCCFSGKLSVNLHFKKCPQAGLLFELSAGWPSAGVTNMMPTGTRVPPKDHLSPKNSTTH